VVFTPPNTLGVNSKDLLSAEVILVCSNPSSPSIPYRLGNPGGAFRQAGFSTLIIDPDDFVKIQARLPKLKCIFMYRPTFDVKELKRVISLHSEEITTVVDNDDLTFDAKHYSPELVPGLRLLPANVMTRTLDAVSLGADLMRASSHLISSTQFLAERMVETSPQSRVLISRNYLTENLTATAKSLKPKSNLRPQDGFRMVYASGTATHEEDFLVAWPSLVKFLERFPFASLTIIGHPPLPRAAIPRSISSQIITEPKLLIQEELLTRLADFDLNLAPLDLETLFNHSKSALKIVHAAAVGVRTIASRTDELLTVSVELDSGYCVPKDGEWLDYLSIELENHSRREFDRGLLQKRTLDKYGYPSFIQSFNPIISELVGPRIDSDHV
jgi:glycosyltransferase involved in cell wall biosynthesis